MQQFTLGLHTDGIAAITLDSLSKVVDTIGGLGPHEFGEDGYVVSLPTYIDTELLRSLHTAVNQIGGSMRIAKNVGELAAGGQNSESETAHFSTNKLQPVEAVVDQLGSFELAIFNSVRELDRFSATEAVDGISGVAFTDPSHWEITIRQVPIVLDRIASALREAGYHAEWAFLDDDETLMELFFTEELTMVNQSEQSEEHRPSVQDLVEYKVSILERIVGSEPELNRHETARRLVEVLDAGKAGSHHRTSDALELIAYAQQTGRMHTISTREGKKLQLGPALEKPHSPRANKKRNSKPENVKNPVIAEVWDEKYNIGLEVLFQAIANLDVKHIQQGVNLNKLWGQEHKLRSAGIDPEMFRRITRLAESSGLLVTTAVNRAGSGKNSGRSRRVSQTIAITTTQQRAVIKESLSKAVDMVKFDFELKNNPPLPGEV
jgi:hypothetical protein